MPFPSCRSRHAQFAIRMKRFLRAYGRKHDGRIPLRAKDGARHVDVGDIDETSRTNLDERVSLVIGSRRSVVINARREISPMRRRNVFSRRGLKIHHVKRLIRRGNDRVALLLKIIEPAQKVFFLEWLSAEKIRKATSENAGASNQRASAKHLEKSSSRFHAVGRVVHTHSPSTIGLLWQRSVAQQRIEVAENLCQVARKRRSHCSCRAEFAAHNPRENFVPFFAGNRPTGMLCPLSFLFAVPVAFITPAQALFLHGDPAGFGLYAHLTDFRKHRAFTFSA